MTSFAKATRRGLMGQAALALAATFGGVAWAQELPDTIRIAHLASMTGGAATVGQNGNIGVEIAIDELNANGGIAGHKVEMVLADDQSDPTAAVNEARRLVLREKVHVIVGPYLSQLTLATAPIFAQTKTVNITTASSSAITVEVAPYEFSVAPSVFAQAEVMMGYAKDTGAKKVAILNDNGALGKAGGQALAQQAEKDGLDLVEHQEFQYRASDVTPQLLSLRKGEPDALVIWPTVGEDAGLIQKNLAEIGWDVPVIGATSVSGQAPAAVKVAGADAYKNTVAVDYGGFAFCDGDPVGESPFGQLMKTVEDKGYDLDEVATQTISLGYDMVMILATAIEKTNSVDGDVLRKFIEEHADELPFTAVTVYSASADQHFMSGPTSLVMIGDASKPREDLLRPQIVGCK